MAKSFIAHPFSSAIVSLIGYSREDACKWLKTKFDIEVDLGGSTAAITISIVTESGGHFVIVHSEKLDPGSLAHESVHAASFVYQHAGATHDIENEEPYAYLVQRIFQTCMEQKNGRRNRRRP